VIKVAVGYHEDDRNKEEEPERMNVPHTPAIPVFLRKKSGAGEQGNKAPEELRIEMQVVGYKMPYQVEKILSRLDIFLATVLTEFTQHFASAVQTVRLLAVFFMAHMRNDLASQR
jgi:hypothetical protein